MSAFFSWLADSATAFGATAGGFAGAGWAFTKSLVKVREWAAERRRLKALLEPELRKAQAEARLRELDAEERELDLRERVERATRADGGNQGVALCGAPTSRGTTCRNPARSCPHPKHHCG